MDLRTFMRGQEVAYVSRGFTINNGDLVFLKIESLGDGSAYHCITRTGVRIKKKPSDKIKLRS